MDTQMPVPAVLVADDDDTIRALVRAVLEEDGYTVYEAADGEPALQQLQKNPQGMVVLLDLNMPGMDGLAVLRAVGADPCLATRHRIIVLSGGCCRTLSPADAQLLAQYGAATVPKPFHVDMLLHIVTEAARQVRQNCPTH